MSDVIFDTHAEIRKLEEMGIPLPQAEALVDMVTRAPINKRVADNLEYLKLQVDANMATKADLAALSNSTRADLAALSNSTRADIAALSNSTQADIAAVAARLDRLDEHVGKHMATKEDLAVLRAGLYRVLWLQGGALATLIVALAGMILVFAGYTQSNA